MTRKSPSLLRRLNRFHWRRLGPADFHDPLTDPSQNFGLHRLVKLIDDDTIELRNYSTGKRWIWLFVSVLIIGGWVVSGPMSYNVSPLPKPLLGLIAPDYYGEWSVSLSERLNYDGTRFEEPYRQERLDRAAQDAREEWKTGVFFLIAFLLPPLYWLFAPAPRGVRIDRRRKVIYSWSWFSLYCFRPHQIDLSELDSYFMSAGPVIAKDYAHGPLIYDLPKASNPAKTRAFVLGRGPTPVYHQYSLMHNAAAQFLHFRKDPEWLVNLKTGPRGRNNGTDYLAAFANFHLIAARWPRSTGRKLDRFLEQQGKSA